VTDWVKLAIQLAHGDALWVHDVQLHPARCADQLEQVNDRCRK